MNVGAVLIRFSGIVKVKVESLMATRQDYEEWQMANAKKPEVRLEYLEYRKLLQLFGECAKILDRSAPTPMIEDNDLLLVPFDDSDPDLTQKFDCRNQLSNQAFVELEESLGLGN